MARAGNRAGKTQVHTDGKDCVGNVDGAGEIDDDDDDDDDRGGDDDDNDDDDVVKMVQNM